MFFGAGVAAPAARSVKLLLATTALILSFAPQAQAETQEKSPDNNSLPVYDYKYSNGLYATLAGYLSVKDIKLRNQRKVELHVPNFRKKFTVQAVIQPQAAPLVVVLLGVDGRADSPLGKLWVSWYADAGYHVLTFDSTFLPSFSEISGHGVAGNLVVEADRIKDVVATFLKLRELDGKVGKIGVVGMSYGGLQSLLLGQMSAQGKLPFELTAVQAYSPPINLQRTGELIDQWHAEDRWEYTLTELAGKMSGHKPVESNADIPFNDSMMRAGIAAVFRLNLADLIVRNDRMYKMNLLPKGDNFDEEYLKRDYAATWGYSKFMSDLSFKYWQQKTGMHDLSELISPIELPNLLKTQPAFSEVILSEDDPFNTAEDSQSLKAAGAANLTVLPHGGHLGFVSEPWTKAKLLSLFNTPASHSALDVQTLKVSHD
jgi:predicted alpha/beta-fold hydrolase